jgi:hypothetical protein
MVVLFRLLQFGELLAFSKASSMGKDLSSTAVSAREGQQQSLILMEKRPGDEVSEAQGKTL